MLPKQAHVSPEGLLLQVIVVGFEEVFHVLCQRHLGPERSIVIRALTLLFHSPVQPLENSFPGLSVNALSSTLAVWNPYPVIVPALPVIDAVLGFSPHL